MTDEKSPPQDNEMSEIAGGTPKIKTQTKFEPYTDTTTPVRCPRCRSSRKMWYHQGMPGVLESHLFWCRNCNYKFDFGL